MPSKNPLEMPAVLASRSSRLLARSVTWASSAARVLLGAMLVLSVLLGGLAGCSHETKSPAVTLIKVEPAKVCNRLSDEPDGLQVKIFGKGFTPMPTQVLQKPAVLILPTVELTQVEDSSGAAVSKGAQITFSGDPKGANAKNLHWKSEGEMMIAVDDKVNGGQPIPGGKYDVTVTNPDGTHKATLNKALEVVPNPKVDAVQPSNVCAGGSQLHVTGSDFLPGATAEIRCPDAEPVRSTSVSVNSETDLDATFGAGAVVGKLCDVVVLNAGICPDIPPHQSVSVVDGPIAFYADPPFVYNGISTRVTVYVTALKDPLTSVRLEPSGATAGGGADGGGGAGIELSNPVIVKGNRAQATVPTGTAAGTYDIVIADGSGCLARFAKGLTITEDLTISLKEVIPPFGADDGSTAVTIFRDTTAAAPKDVSFSETPRAFLNPKGAGPSDLAIALSSVTMIDGDKLTAVVPGNTPAKVYDLVVINPDGAVGYLPDAYTSLTEHPPVVDDITPQSMVNATGQVLDVQGSNLRGSTAALTCKDPAGTVLAPPPVTSAAETCPTPETCTQKLTVDGSALPTGTVCVVRMTNADGSYADYSAVGVTGPSLNLQTPKAGAPLLTGRRALVSASAKATSAARFLYAVGGDGGQATAANPFASVEFAPVDLFGAMQPWVAAKPALGTARSYAGSATIGRYIYVFGGSDGTAALASAERALILSPEETPVIQDVDLSLCPPSTGTVAGCPAADSGLPGGQYSYRVAATFDAVDPHNPGGESLASDAFVLKLPVIANKKISVKVLWSVPVDKLGQPLGGVSGYRVYRTPKDGIAGKDEVLLATVTGGGTLEYLDDGLQALGTEAPLPLGSTGAWAKLGDMSAPRMGPGGAAAADPADPSTWYVYALLGKNGAAGHTSYEFLTVTKQPNGYQTVSPAWTAGTTASASERWEIGAWVVDHSIALNVPAPDTYVYVGGGRAAAGTMNGFVESPKVTAGGQLGAFTAVKAFPADLSGYGVAAAAGQLFTFGGAGGLPSDKATSAKISTAPPTLDPGSWNNEGITMTSARYLMGSCIQSAFIFLVGGEATAGGPATKSSETVVW